MKFSRLALRILLCLSVLLIMSCGTGKQPADKTGENKSAGKRQDLYIEVSALSAVSYFYDHKMGLQRAGEDFGVETEYKGPPDWNMQAMIQAIELAVARKPAGIMVVGFEESLNDAVNKAVDAGIPVVTLDSDLPNSKRIAFVGTGNYDAGYRGGLKLGQLVGGKGKVAILTKVGQDNLEKRVQGYKDALATFPGVEIVRVADTKSDVVLSAQAASAVLTSVPDIAGFGCVEAAGPAGAATAIKEAGLVGKVKVVAMDRDNDVLTYIRDGVIDATIVQQTALMPYYGLMILYQLNHHDIPVSSDNTAAEVSGVPRYIDTGTILVDRSNCEYFMR
ncbi:substrate-binding domain-containing protein [bacterium]|nr:substrate-binding domain-containing protein [bacterium]